jgi:hypothetical protein
MQVIRFSAICVFAHLTECRGTLEGYVGIVQADTGATISRTRTHHWTGSSDPLDLVGVSFRILNCRFPAPGLYWVQFWCNQTMLDQRPLILR